MKTPTPTPEQIATATAAWNALDQRSRVALHRRLKIDNGQRGMAALSKIMCARAFKDLPDFWREALIPELVR